VFNSDRKGHLDLYTKDSSGAGAEDLLFSSSVDKMPNSWSSDGKVILYTNTADPKTSRLEVWALPLATGKPIGFAQGSAHYYRGEFSPDGRWVAYCSNESQRDEIYVAPFPGPGNIRRISIAGGGQPRWSHDGKEIFYVANGQLWAADIRLERGNLEVGVPHPLFTLLFYPHSTVFAVSSDRQRFLVITLAKPAVNAPLTLVQNWTLALKR
jgi:Tol biopolymer transport system component